MSSIHILRKKYNQGFGLLDVLITIFVLAVALLSLGGLHTAIIKSSSLAKARTNATSLAQEKLDDLRSYADNSSDSIFAYSSIASGNTGGAYNTIPTTDNVTYARNWYVYSFNMCTDNAAPTVAGATCTKTVPDLKLITMAVSWTDESSAPRILGLQSAISNISVTNSGAAYTPNYSGAPDFVLNTSYTATDDDTVKHNVGTDTLKKASQPVPDTDRTNQNDNSYNTVTTFKEEYYSTSNTFLGGSTFVTINCNCTKSGTGGYLPSLWSGSKFVANGWDASKANGVKQSNQESNLCTACCRDHHDDAAAPGLTSSSSGAAPSGYQYKYDPFRPYTGDYTSNAHNHYNYSSSTLVIAPGSTNANKDYVEACRMVWNEGRLQLLQDWRLEDIRVFPSSLLAASNTTNITTYANYVAAFVKAYFDAIAAAPSAYPQTPPNFACTNGGSTACPTELTTALSALTTAAASDTTITNFTATSQSSSFSARAIYIDYMQPELFDKIYCLMNPGSPKKFDSAKTCDSGTAQSFSSVLSMIPFHDINVTRLAHWSSSNTTVATVTDTTLTDQNDEDDSLNLDRGKVRPTSPLTTGSSTITVSMKRSNAGITDSNPIDLDDSGASLSRSFTVSASGSSTTNYTVSGSISLGDSNTHISALTDISVAGSNGASCSTSSLTTSPVTLPFTCTLTNGTGTITFGGYSLKSGNDTYNNCMIGTGTKQVNNDGVVTGNSSAKENTQFTFTGLTANQSLNISVRSQTSATGSGNCP